MKWIAYVHPDHRSSDEQIRATVLLNHRSVALNDEIEIREHKWIPQDGAVYVFDSSILNPGMYSQFTFLPRPTFELKMKPPKITDVVS